MGGFGSGHGSGGKREGAGRPKSTPRNIKKPRSIRATDHEWDELHNRAAAAGLSLTEFLLTARLTG